MRTNQRRRKRRLALFDGFKFNSVIRVLVYSDILILSAFGLLAPIFAIFVIQNIQGGSAEVAGFAAMTHLLSRALFQIPVASFIDKKTGERDDFWLDFIGSVGVSIIPVTYLLASTPAHLYAIQAVYGFLHALTYPSWMAIFTRHIDPHEEGMEWAIYNTTTDLGAAIAAGVGGVIAITLGFRALFVAVTTVSLLGSLLLFKVYPSMKKRT